jgi:serine/threonine protein kinase
VKSAGPYVIQGELGRGGMGAVYRAKHSTLGQEVALKILVRDGFLEDDSVERFQIEAQALALLRHRNVVGVHDFGVCAQGHYIAMELVEGDSLDRRLARGGPFDPRAAAELTLALAEGVAHAHEQGVLHRDLKPSNVLLRAPKDEPVLTDFGLARRLDAKQQLTLTGEILGTPSYMAPEQAGLGGGPTVRTDVYGLGGVLYALLTGGPPFQAAGVIATLDQVLNDPPRPPGDVRGEALDRRLEQLCLRCLAKEPGERFADVPALCAALRAFLAGEGVRSGRRVALSGALVLAVGALGVGGWWASRAPEAALAASPAAPTPTSAGSPASPVPSPIPSPSPPEERDRSPQAVKAALAEIVDPGARQRFLADALAHSSQARLDYALADWRPLVDAELEGESPSALDRLSLQLRWGGVLCDLGPRAEGERILSAVWRELGGLWRRWKGDPSVIHEHVAECFFVLYWQLRLRRDGFGSYVEGALANARAWLELSNPPSRAHLDSAIAHFAAAQRKDTSKATHKLEVARALEDCQAALEAWEGVTPTPRIRRGRGMAMWSDATLRRGSGHPADVARIFKRLGSDATVDLVNRVLGWDSLAGFLRGRARGHEDRSKKLGGGKRAEALEASRDAMARAQEARGESLKLYREHLQALAGTRASLILVSGMIRDGDPEAALQLIAEVLNCLKDSSAPYSRTRCRLHEARAKLALKLRDWDQASVELDKALGFLRPVGVLLQRARIHLIQDQGPAAAELLKEIGPRTSELGKERLALYEDLEGLLEARRLWAAGEFERALQAAEGVNAKELRVQSVQVLVAIAYAVLLPQRVGVTKPLEEVIQKRVRASVLGWADELVKNLPQPAHLGRAQRAQLSLALERAKVGLVSLERLRAAASDLDKAQVAQLPAYVRDGLAEDMTRLCARQVVRDQEPQPWREKSLVAWARWHSQDPGGAQRLADSILLHRVPNKQMKNAIAAFRAARNEFAPRRKAGKALLEMLQNAQEAYAYVEIGRARSLAVQILERYPKSGATKLARLILSDCDSILAPEGRKPLKGDLAALLARGRACRFLPNLFQRRRALRQLSEVVQRSEDQSQKDRARKYRYRLLLAAKRHGLALLDLNRLVELEPQRHSLRITRAKVQLSLGRNAAARADLEALRGKSLLAWELRALNQAWSRWETATGGKRPRKLP